MAEENVIYTDGHNVKVTPYQFIVGSHRYKLGGITNVQMHSIAPNRTPGIVAAFIGIIAIICGTFNLIPPDVYSLGDIFITSNKLSILVGGLLILIGMVWIFLHHTKYAVRITTAEGEKNTVISPEKDYIHQIVNAINSAFRIVHS